MRLGLLAICVALLIGTAWFAIDRGADTTGLRGAPQIERLVVEEVRSAIAGTASPAITISAIGRQVMLTGPVESEEKRKAIVEAALTARLVGGVTDRIVVVQTVNPFTFTAEKTADGGFRLSGHVPTRAAEDQILAQARLSAQGATVRSELAIAGGVPKDDWAGAVLTGLRALEPLKSGSVVFSDMVATVTGEVANAEETEAVERVVAEAPAGTWDLTIAGAVPIADPYRFTALKTADGAVIVGGNAPDDPTRSLLISSAAELGTIPPDGDLAIARGMPAAGWPKLVRRGLAALAIAESGFLNVEDMAVNLTVEVATEDDRLAFDSSLGDGWSAEVTVIDPAPAPELVIELTDDGALAISGLLPPGLDRSDLAELFPEASVEELGEGAGGSADSWYPAFEALRIVLPRLFSATANVTSQRFVLVGKLRRGFSSEGSAAAVRTVMPRAWDVALDFTESAPLAEMILSMRDREIALSGLLPRGLDPSRALRLFGDAASGEGLASGGDGDSESWAQSLGVLGKGLGFFEDATGRIAEGTMELDGRLRPGYSPNDVQQWLEARVAEDWSVGLSADETSPNEGDTRLSLATGEREYFRSGFWLPEVDFPVSAERCAAEIMAALSSENVTFIPGSARLDAKAKALIDRLAAISIRCLNSSQLRLEIVGHTDAVGNDEANQALSEQRAETVRAALAERGVREDAMTSVGLGESEPVATNDTPEGRAANRRIEFAWSATGQ